MSYLHEPQRSFVPFGNPFHRLIPKGSYLSPKSLSLLNSFEESLARRIENIKPADTGDVLTLSWMKTAIESLCGVHADIKDLITALELPIGDWDDKWIDVYLNDSVKLLDICIAFSYEISRLKQGQLFLHSALHNLTTMNQIPRARSSLDEWKHHIGSKNPRLEKCFPIMDSLAQTLDLPKIKNSTKGKVLMRAMYGVKVVALFVCSVFAALFSGSSKTLMEVKVPKSYSWAKSFADLEMIVYTEIRNTYSTEGFRVLKEIEAVDTVVGKVYSIMQDGFVLDSIPVKVLEGYKSDLEGSVEKLGRGLDVLAKEVDSFFRVVLTGRDALLGNFRVGTNV